MKNLSLLLLVVLSALSQSVAFSEEPSESSQEAATHFKRSLELKAKMLNLPQSVLQQVEIETGMTPDAERQSVVLVQRTDSGIGIRLNTKTWSQVQSQSEKDGIMDRVTEAMLRVGFEKHDFINSAGFGLIYRLSK